MTAHCGRLDPHPGHGWSGRPSFTGETGPYDFGGAEIRPADRICPGEVVIEGGAECPLHQRPIATCQCRAEQRARWAS